MDTLVQDLLRELECPVCMDFMVPPISMCSNGHNLCSVCLPNVSQCPICRGTFMGTRCIALENMCRLITHPCRFKKSGCTAHCLLEFKDQHEDECRFKSYKCPYVMTNTNCTWKGPLMDMKDHITNYHDFIDDKDTKRSFVARPNFLTREVVFRFNEIFFMYSKTTSNLVQQTFMYVGSEQQAKRYVYKITIESPDGKHSMSVCLPCPSYLQFIDKPLSFVDDLCAIFPASFYKNFVYGDERIPFEFEILEVTPNEM